MRLDHTKIALRWAWYRFTAWAPDRHLRNIVQAVLRDVRAEPLSADEECRGQATPLRRPTVQRRSA